MGPGTAARGGVDAGIYDAAGWNLIVSG
jgi:hypothetical protein